MPWTLLINVRRITLTCGSIRNGFGSRPDGSLQYAENPPKKYEDIYPFDFETEAWRELWEELKDVAAVLDPPRRADPPRR